VLHLNVSRLSKLRKAEVHAVHSAKFSFEFYRHNFREFILADESKADSITEAEMDGAPVVEDQGCNFDWVQNTDMMLEEVSTVGV
jgi:hypothetical protein